MKRIYKKRTRSAIKEKALNQIKETRSKMYEEHPELFKAIELLVKQSQKQGVVQEDSIAIDKEKNIETVLRFISLKPESSQIKADLKKILN